MSARVVLGLVRDLFFRSKLDGVADSAGVDLCYASDLEAASPTVMWAGVGRKS